ncbi:MAG: hypothetical protein ACPGLV_01015 [Bacteroidia bacterium]
MKRVLLFSVLPLMVFLTACGQDDDTPIDEGNKNEPQTVEELATILGGEGGYKLWEGDSLVWEGKEWWQSLYDPATDTYEEEQEVTDDPNYQFLKHKIWFKHSQYSTERFGYPVGKGIWTDRLGSTGFNYEFTEGEMETIYVNKTESYPPDGGRQDWTIITLTDDEFSFERDWRYGGEIKKDRFVWTKKK